MAIILDAARRGQLSREQAEALPRLGSEAVTLFALAMAAHVAGLRAASVSPSTPSAMVPVYHKPSVGGRRKSPGARDGHEGSRRKTPPKIDARVEHRLEVCPCCGGPLQRCKRSRTRVIEDIPQQVTPVVTEHTVHRDYCPACKKHVEPVVPDAMPNAALGHHVMALSRWFHYGLGITIGQVRDILAQHLHTQVTAGGLVDGWGRLGGDRFVQTLRADSRAALLFETGELDPERCADIVRRYRQTYPQVPTLWKALEQRFQWAMRGREQTTHRVRLDMRAKVMHIWLPSGRALRYHDLRWQPSKGRQKLVHGRGVSIYGGMLTENVVQAIARDILVEAILRLEAAALPVAFHVHDEVIVEVETPRAEEAAEQVRTIMTEVPQWAAGLPLACEVSIADRYGKH